jgi:hypothetical protein
MGNFATRDFIRREAKLCPSSRIPPPSISSSFQTRKVTVLAQGQGHRADLLEYMEGAVAVRAPDEDDGLVGRLGVPY